MHELARNPEHISKLRDELAPHMPNPHTAALHQDIANLDHLNAVIYETLRLYPPVPTALPRKTPPEGIEINGVHIPGDMTVWCPQYPIGRSKLMARSVPYPSHLSGITDLSIFRREDLHACYRINSRALVSAPRYDQREVSLGTVLCRYAMPLLSLCKRS